MLLVVQLELAQGEHPPQVDLQRSSFECAAIHRRRKEAVGAASSFLRRTEGEVGVFHHLVVFATGPLPPAPHHKGAPYRSRCSQEAEQVLDLVRCFEAGRDGASRLLQRVGRADHRMNESSRAALL